MNKLIALLLAFTLSASELAASPGPDQKHIDAIKKKVFNALENSRHIVIETYDDRALQGTISEAGTDNFILDLQQKSTTLSYADVRKIKWHSPMPREVKTILIATAVTGILVLGVVLAGGLRD